LQCLMLFYRQSSPNRPHRPYILCPFGRFLGYLVYFMGIWYIFASFGMLCQENLATLTTATVTQNCRPNLIKRRQILCKPNSAPTCTFFERKMNRS
jgi:hypothetical protein